MTYTYDGDGNMVKSVINEVTTYYVGSYYEKKVRGSEQNERKTYFAGTTRIAMDENDTLTWLISDHLGSTSLIVDATGTLLSRLKYTAFGELRSGTAATDYRYTGQRQEAEIGLYFYVSRFFDPSLGRFISPDTIVPGAGNSQAYDRYSYVFNNPINGIDPTGHIACFDGEQCFGSNKPVFVPTIKTLKNSILANFGITMSDDKSNWNLKGLETVFSSLHKMNSAINGKLKDTIGGSTFYYNGIEKGYSGRTNPNDITFNVKSGNPPPVHLIYHEVAHLINFMLGNYFTNALASNQIKLNDGSYLMGGPVPYKRNSTGYKLLNLIDPNTGGSIEAELGFLDDSYYSADEEWGDLFANYMSGNFNLEQRSGAGIKRMNWVISVLTVQFGD